MSMFLLKVPSTLDLISSWSQLLQLTPFNVEDLVTRNRINF